VTQISVKNKLSNLVASAKAAVQNFGFGLNLAYA